MDFILPVEVHNALIAATYRKRGYNEEEAKLASRACEMASTHGIKTHNGLKALHLDHLFGTGNKLFPCCHPNAKVEKLPTRFKAVQKWNANMALGQSVAIQAIETCIKLADEYGSGTVVVDNAFHYLWGGGYVLEAAKRGYYAYTNCTATLSEVVPFGGKFPTLGTNPHSWGLPTTESVGFPILIDWATSTIATGRVQQLAREGKPLPPNSAVDKDGNITTDPNKVAALLTFGAHKGYGLSLLNEVLAAMAGGSLPTTRARPDIAAKGDKLGCNFFFQVIHPEAISCGAFAFGRSQQANIKAVIGDILGHGNDKAILPGQLEHQAACKTAQAGGLIFTEAEIKAFVELAQEAGFAFDPSKLKKLA